VFACGGPEYLFFMFIDLEKINQEYRRQNPADFVTHLNYVDCLRQLSEDLSLQVGIHIEGKLAENQNLYKKINLLSLTYKSLEGEKQNIIKDPEYSIICISWVAVKSYYLIYYAQIILLSLLYSDFELLHRSHDKAINDINRLLIKNHLVFNKMLFNQVLLLKDVKLFKTKMENVRFINVDIENRCKQILKKLVEYKLVGFAHRASLKNFRTKAAKSLRDEYLGKSSVSFSNFFYEYRLKANYRDLSFLDHEMSTTNAVNYFNAYYGLTMNFLSAYAAAINQLSQIRLGKAIWPK